MINEQYLFRLTKEVFGDHCMAEAWFNSPNKEFSGQSPREASLNDCRKVQKFLKRIEKDSLINY